MRVGGADEAGVVTEWRLVITGRVGERPVAHIYPADASRFDDAAFHFDLEADQELPRVAPGALVEASGTVEAGAYPTFRSGTIVIRPARGLKTGGQMLAERGNVIAHPAIVGSHPGWRYVQSHSFDDVQTWDSFVRRRYRGALSLIVSLLALTVVLVAVVVYVLVSGDGHGGGAGAGGAAGGGSGLGVVAALLLAMRARRALQGARRLRDTPGEPMFMHLWWSAGNGHGPIAIASLGPTPDDVDTVRVPVVGVPDDLAADDGVIPVSVRGFHTGTPLIEVHGQLLWPAEAARRAGLGRDVTPIPRPPVGT